MWTRHIMSIFIYILFHDTCVLGSSGLYRYTKWIHYRKKNNKVCRRMTTISWIVIIHNIIRYKDDDDRRIRRHINIHWETLHINVACRRCSYIFITCLLFYVLTLIPILDCEKKEFQRIFYRGAGVYQVVLYCVTTIEGIQNMEMQTYQRI